MEAKEKALELVNNFYENGVQDEEYSMEYADGKKCALICVNEILNSHMDSVYETYYLKVKQEINKL